MSGRLNSLRAESLNSTVHLFSDFLSKMGQCGSKMHSPESQRKYSRHREVAEIQITLISRPDSIMMDGADSEKAL
jgi:hypothetical protein